LAAIAHPSRIERTFGFVDLCGFTDFVDRHGDEAGVEQVRHLRSVVREVAPLFAVRVDKWLGDGVMLVGVDSAPLAAAVVAIAHRAQHHGSLSLRAGIAVGPVMVVEGDDYLGRTVNVAARLCDVAIDGQVLAATSGLELPEWIDQAPRPSLHLRGVAEPITVVELQPTADVFREPAHDRSGWSIGALLGGIARPARLLRGA
jgi:class 3 adenylate cyclase